MEKFASINLYDLSSNYISVSVINIFLLGF